MATHTHQAERRPTDDWAPHPREVVIALRFHEGDVPLVMQALRFQAANMRRKDCDNLAEKIDEAREHVDAADGFCDAGADEFGYTGAMSRVVIVERRLALAIKDALQSYALMRCGGAGASGYTAHTDAAAWGLADELGQVCARVFEVWSASDADG